MTATHASFFDQRWLTDDHRERLRAGGDRIWLVPEFTSQDHNGVLVSVSDEASSTEMSWVDEGIAELVWLLSTVEGIWTVEGCQGGPDSDSADAYLAFKDRRQARRFIRLAATLGEPKPKLWRWPSVVVVFHPDWIPLIVAELRRQAPEAARLDEEMARLPAVRFWWPRWARLRGLAS